MVVCRFYMQGNCRYGNKCFNEHPSPNQGYSVTAQRQLFGGGRNQNQRVQFRDNYSNNSYSNNSYSNNQNPYKWTSQDAQHQQQNRAPAAAQGPLSASDIVKSLAGEMEQVWEGGKMWPFSCIGYEKESASLPGFTDMSYDELRHEAYEARKQGAFELYVQRVASLFSEVDIRRQELKNPNMNLKQKLISFIDDNRRKQQSSSTNQTSLFSDSSLFGPESSTQQSTGLFGSQSSGFGQQTDGNQSSFGQSGNQSLFGQTGSQSLFGQQSQTSSGGFGQSAGGFGQSSTGFGQPSTGQTSVFGQPVQPAADSLQTPKASLFGKPAQFGTPVAGSSQSPGLFGSAQPSAPTQNLFGSSSVAPQGSSFGQGFATQAAPVSAPVSNTTPESSVYSSVDKLTAEELEQFKAPTFTVGLIPTKPPPKELCF